MREHVAPGRDLEISDRWSDVSPSHQRPHQAKSSVAQRGKEAATQLQ
jgi:hypothetical protein